MKKRRAKALAEKQKQEGEAMDIDGQEGETKKEESPVEEDALICCESLSPLLISSEYIGNLMHLPDSTIEAPPSLIPATRYCDITGLEVG